MKIVLFQPEIPQNTGNIIRTCAVTNCELILVRPFSFSLSTRQLKRSGLDYFDDVNIKQIDDLELYLSSVSLPFYFFSSKATKKYSDIKYTNDSILIFGSETQGLPKLFFQKWKDKFVTIPMANNKRCLNLSNSVAIAIYEANRQQQFTFSS